MAFKSTFRFFLIAMAFLGLTPTLAQAQETQIVRLNEHFYPINENDSINYFYKAIIVNLTDSTSIERIFTPNNQMIRISRFGYNEEGNFPEEKVENYDLDGYLTSKKIKNQDNGLFLTKYYSKGEYIGEALYTVDRKHEIRKSGTADVVTTELNEFEPTPRTDKILFQKHLIKTLSYPTAARKSKSEGTVILALRISSEGVLERIEIANPTRIDDSLEEEAIRVIKAYKGKFLPATTLEGFAIDSWLYIPLRFKLD